MVHGRFLYDDLPDLLKYMFTVPSLKLSDCTLHNVKTLKNSVDWKRTWFKPAGMYTTSFHLFRQCIKENYFSKKPAHKNRVLIWKAFTDCKLHSYILKRKLPPNKDRLEYLWHDRMWRSHWFFTLRCSSTKKSEWYKKL